MNINGSALEFAVKFTAGRRGRKQLVTATDTSTATARIPRVAKLMALSIRIDGLIRSGELCDWADAARLGRITRARASQLAAMLLLAPDITEEILHLPAVTSGRDKITERYLRPIAAKASWAQQRRMWRSLATLHP